MGFQFLTLKGVKLFRVRFSPENNPSFVANRYLNVLELHPLRPKIAYMLARRERNILWRSLLPGTMTGGKRVLRSWCARRVQIAFREALRQHGFDNEGRRLVLDPQGTLLRKEAGLQGSLDIRLDRSLIQEKSDEILRQAGCVIKALAHLSSTKNQRNSRYLKGRGKDLSTGTPLPLTMAKAGNICVR